jgi:hypothetical protein
MVIKPIMLRMVRVRFVGMTALLGCGRVARGGDFTGAGAVDDTGDAECGGVVLLR